MNSTNFGLKMLAVAAVGAALAGCDSIKDVRSEPSTPLPTPTAVLEGTVKGVSSKRAVILTYNGTLSGTVGVTAPAPSEANEGLNGVVPFAFNTLPAGTAYNVTVYQQPLGKFCEVKSGGTGVLEANVKTNVVVECRNLNVGETGAKPRYSMTVTLDSNFADNQGAQVVLTTEEAIYRKTNIPHGTTSVTFDNVLMNPSPSTQGFNYSVIASNTIGGTVNKCGVTNPTNVSTTGVITNPTGNVTNVAVGLCTFSIGGKVSYSPRLVGGTPETTPAAPTGLVLELRDLLENSVRTLNFSGAWGSSFTFMDGSSPAKFVSNRNAIYSVAVKTQPNNMACVVVNPMAILYAPTLASNPIDISTTLVAPNTFPSVQCRQTPATERQLEGVYRHTTTSWKRNSTSPTQVVTYNSLDFSRHNVASSNMIAFFKNGTYIYGTHANSSQIEHGFYDYDPTAHTLTFTLNADTNPIVIFPKDFQQGNYNAPGVVPTTSPGLSAVPTPDAQVVGGVRYPMLTGVVVDPAGKITGTFSGKQSVGILNPTPTNLGTGANAPVIEPAATMDWVLQAPPSITSQMTGAWLAQDNRRLWVFDKETYYGMHVGVVGVYALNDACFTMPDVTASSGLYTRRPSINGCYPWPRPGTGQTPTYAPTVLVESIDLKVPQFIPLSATSTAGGNVDIGTLPTYMARIPGGSQAVDGRSPSPIVFHIAPAAQFYNNAPSEYFPSGDTTWCHTEILGIRATLNAVPIHKPVYFCRFVPGTP